MRETRQEEVIASMGNGGLPNLLSCSYSVHTDMKSFDQLFLEFESHYSIVFSCFFSCFDDICFSENHPIECLNRTAQEFGLFF